MVLLDWRRRILSASAEDRNSCQRKHPAEILALAPSCAFHRRSSNANSLCGRNSARSPEIRAIFQRDNLPRHFGVRVLHAQPGSWSPRELRGKRDGGGAFLTVMFGQIFAYSAFSDSHFSSPGSVSGLIASTGHSGSHTPQSMHWSGSMTSMFSPSWKQSTGHTSTQSMVLQRMQLSLTT